MVAGFYPAWKASRYLPVDALRALFDKLLQVCSVIVPFRGFLFEKIVKKDRCINSR